MATVTHINQCDAAKQNLERKVENVDKYLILGKLKKKWKKYQMLVV